MKLNLTKPLVVFDLETTGVDVGKDRIIQVSYIRVALNGEEKRENYLVNPEMPIPPVVEALTHITNEMVAAAPTFKQLATTLYDDFVGCDFAGYNSNHFDIPLLAEEFLRAGIDFDFTECRLIDSMKIFTHMEKRTLAAAYKFYCGRKMEEDFQAHRADEDTEATWRVLQAQLEFYSPERQLEAERILPNDMDVLHEISNTGRNVDFAGRLVWKELTSADGQPLLDDEGKPMRAAAFNFGKYKDQFVADVLKSDPSYYDWMMNAEFPQTTKQALTRLRMKNMQASAEQS